MVLQAILSFFRQMFSFDCVVHYAVDEVFLAPQAIIECVASLHDGPARRAPEAPRKLPIVKEPRNLTRNVMRRTKISEQAVLPILDKFLTRRCL